MSEYDELVSGLRERAEHAATEGNMTATCDARYFAQSADAIKALQSEVERLKGVLGPVLEIAERNEPGLATQAARAALEAKP